MLALYLPTLGHYFCVGGLIVDKLKRETGVNDSQLATRIRQEDVISIYAGSSPLVSVNTYKSPADTTRTVYLLVGVH